jgi:hypothetical protein
MSGGMSRSILWAIRDNRTLSEHAKIAYIMLWSRGDDIRPSLLTIAGDMGASKATAKRAIRELEDAHLLKRIPRRTAGGDSDSNAYELIVPAGSGHTDPTPGHTDPTCGITQTPKDRTLKNENEGRNSRASRRARPAVERDDDKIAKVQRAVILRGWVLAELDDERALDTWARFVTDRKTTAPIKDYVKYLTGIFDSFDSLDGVLSNTGEREAD